MKLFGKIISGKIKAELLGRFGMVVVTGLSVLLVGIFSFAWFSRNTTSGGSGMQLAVHTEGYDIFIERTYDGVTGDIINVYDSAGDYPAIAPAGRVKDILAAGGYDFTETSTNEAPKIAYELRNEYVFEDKYNLMPGAYGTLTFFLKPASEERLNLNFTIRLGAYVLGYDNEDNEVFRELTTEHDSDVLNLLKGHFLFFTERDGATYDGFVYSGFITSGEFSFDTSEHVAISGTGTEKDGSYEVTLYWEWPLTYYEIIDNISDNENAAGDVSTGKYPAAVGSFLSNTEYFFLTVGTDNYEKAGFYNDADQIIGTNANAIVVYITVR
ncbi:MAG: hypothetical protein J6126_03090 [Clostridia bacterium]|nr:hypothetical protein [Clostridia bacterium]